MKTPLGCGLLFFAGALGAQQYVITTVAGGAPPPTPANGPTVSIGSPNRVATDGSGNLYFTSVNCAFRLDASGVVTRIAGNSKEGYSGDGGPAVNAQLSSPGGMAIDDAGNLFIADAGNGRVRKVSTTGIITTVAGTGVAGFSGDAGPAVSAQLDNPVDVALDDSGNLFVAANGRVRRVSPDGIISTIAGDGFFNQVLTGDGGPATNAGISPTGVAVDRSGSLFIVDSQHSSVRKVSSNGIITTVAGDGVSGFFGDGGPATRAQLYLPVAVAVDKSGDLFIADSFNNRVREVPTNGIISTVAGIGVSGFSGDGGAAVSAQITTNGVAVDGSGSVFISDPGYGHIRKVSNGIITTVVGNGPFPFSGDGGLATNAQLYGPSRVAVDAAG